MNEPVIEIPVDEILSKLEHGEAWIQEAWENAEGMCLHQGIRVCQPRKGDAFIIEQVADKQGWGVDWNDDDGRTFDDVKQTLVEHREILPHELEAVFGPQWLQIVDLVRSAAELSVKERRALCAVTDFDMDRPWDTALNAARLEGREGAIGATGSAAVEAVMHSAQSAAQATAWALVVRDLIGQHDFTQEHYNLLTKPWAIVIGPVHPEDEATR